MVATITNAVRDAKLGVDLENPYTTQEFELGEKVQGNEASEWVFVRNNSGAAIVINAAVVIDENFDILYVNNTNTASAFGDSVGVLVTELADGEYGWVCIKGVVSVLVAANAAANAVLNGTATDGVLDDDQTASSEDIDGIVLTVANGGSQAAVEANLNYPTVGATN